MISVIIPNYNGIKYLRECIDALIKEIKKYGMRQIEVIIVDNGSRDSDYMWVKKEYPMIIWRQLDKNYGFSRAVNEGIAMAKGEYILLLNNDTKVQPGFINALVLQIQDTEKIFSVSSQMIQYHNPNRIDDAGDEYTLLGWTKKNGNNKPVEHYNESKEVFSTCAGAALYRKSILDKIGYFDDKFFAYMEDVDISYRAKIYGYKNIYCAQAKVLHIGSATSGSKYNAFKVKLAARNNVYVVYKNMPLLQLFINIPFLAIGYSIKYLYFVKKGFGNAYKEGFCEGVKTLNTLEKVPFKVQYLRNYFRIQWLLIKNTITYFS